MEYKREDFKELLSEECEVVTKSTELLMNTFGNAVSALNAVSYIAATLTSTARIIAGDEDMSKEEKTTSLKLIAFEMKIQAQIADRIRAVNEKDFI